MFGSLFLMTQYWQFVHGYSPLEAGVRLIPYAATMMVHRSAVAPAGRTDRDQARRHDGAHPRRRRPVVAVDDRRDSPTRG